MFTEYEKELCKCGHVRLDHYEPFSCNAKCHFMTLRNKRIRGECLCKCKGFKLKNLRTSGVDRHAGIGDNRPLCKNVV